MKQLLADIKCAMRQLRRSRPVLAWGRKAGPGRMRDRGGGCRLSGAPGFAVTAALTLALGIGANSAILSWISARFVQDVSSNGGTKF